MKIKTKRYLGIPGKLMCFSSDVDVLEAKIIELEEKNKIMHTNYKELNERKDKMIEFFNKTDDFISGKIDKNETISLDEWKDFCITLLTENKQEKKNKPRWSKWYAWDSKTKAARGFDTVLRANKDGSRSYKIKLDGMKVIKYKYKDNKAYYLSIIDKEKRVDKSDVLGHDSHNKIIIIKEKQ